MKHFSKSARLSIIRKAIKCDAGSVKTIASENNVGYSTLQKWLRAYREGNTFECESSAQAGGSDERAKELEHVIATGKLEETALGAYCREHGIYSHQIETWKLNFMQTQSRTDTKGLREELKQYKQENKRLKQDLNRKDKALAETSALLVLKKKADLIWGGLGDD